MVDGDRRRRISYISAERESVERIREDKEKRKN